MDPVTNPMPDIEIDLEEDVAPLGHTHPVGLLSFSPDGQMLASTSSQETMVLVWEASTGRLLHASRWCSFIKWIEFLDNQTILVVDDAEKIRWNFKTSLWQHEVLEKDEIYQPLDHLSRRLTISLVDGHLPIVGDDGMYLYVTKNGFRVAEYDHGTSVWSLALAPDQKSLALGGGCSIFGGDPSRGERYTTGEIQMVNIDQGDQRKWHITLRWVVANKNYDGCFIATAAFGSPKAPQIEVLRLFRDQCLLGQPVGQWLVRRYYQVSPSLAAWVNEWPMARWLARKLIVEPAVIIAERLARYKKFNL